MGKVASYAYIFSAVLPFLHQMMIHVPPLCERVRVILKAVFDLLSELWYIVEDTVFEIADEWDKVRGSK